MGESGSGKTTTGRVVVKLTKQTGGTVRLDGEDVSALWGTKELRAYRRRVQMIFQDPYETLNPKHTIRAFVAEPLVVNGIGTRGRARGQGPRRARSRRAAPGRRLRRPLPPRAVGRPAPAGRDRRGTRHGPRGDRRRRAGIDAGRLDPDRAAAADARPPRGAWADVSLHHPRPVAGMGHRRPDRSDVPRQDHGDRSRGIGHQPAPQPVHPGPRLGVADADAADRPGSAPAGRSSSARHPTPPTSPTAAGSIRAARTCSTAAGSRSRRCSTSVAASRPRAGSPRAASRCRLSPRESRPEPPPNPRPASDAPTTMWAVSRCGGRRPRGRSRAGARTRHGDSAAQPPAAGPRPGSADTPSTARARATSAARTLPRRSPPRGSRA